MTAEQIAKRAAALLAHAAKNASLAPGAAKKIGGWIVTGAKPLPADVLQMRRDTCEACGEWKPLPHDDSAKHCSVCKCLALKLAIPSSKCPLGKWEAHHV